MSFTNKTTHYELPQWVGTDKPSYLVDQNNAYAAIDSAIFAANTAAASAVSTSESAQTSAQSANTAANSATSAAATANQTAESAVSSATSAVQAANTATSTANAASTKADSALSVANNANTAAGGAVTAAQSAQTASSNAVSTANQAITNFATAYDATKLYAVGDYCRYNGIFYRCITAITTAHAFNVDEWDDVTVAERLKLLENPASVSVMNYFHGSLAASGWTSATLSGNTVYKQDTTVSGMTANVQLGAPMCEQTQVIATNKLNQSALNLINDGYCVAGDGKVTVYVETAPTTNITVFWTGKEV